MKKLFCAALFFTLLGFQVFGDADGREEIDFLLFSPNSGSAFVNETQAMYQLDNLARYLMDRNLMPGQIHIYGYAAAVKDAVDPVDLSRDRALFTMSELRNRGVPGNLFSPPVALGEVDFWGSNLSEEGRVLNRRVRILVDYVPPPVLAAGGDAAPLAVFPADELRPGVPWLLLLLLLLAVVIIAAVVFFAFRCRKTAGKPGKVMEHAAPDPFAAICASAAADGSIDEDWEEAPPLKTGKDSKFADMKKAIRDIISGIPLGAYFDVHAVIQKMLQEHDDVYLMNVGNYTTAAHYHSRISAIIAETGMVDKAGNSCSKNIHAKFSECHLFRRKL
ncbi:MAG: hypothetical protein FWC64_08000 [Treponema sp.]|nr:hypothetical protein [Treponema sp.]